MEANFNEIIRNELPENERYSFSFAPEENKKRFKLAMKGFVRNTVILTVLLLIISVILNYNYYEYSSFIFVFAVIYGMLQFYRYIETRKKWRISAEKSAGDEDIYEIKEDKIIYLNIKGGELITKHTIPYDEINFVDEDENYIIFQYANVIFTMRKAEIHADSSLYRHIEDIKSRLKKQSKYMLGGGIIAVAVLCAVSVAVTVVYAAEKHFMHPAYWCYLPFIVAPIVSLIYAFILKKKNYQYALNLITGIVISIVILACGSMQLKYINYFGDSMNIVTAAEEKLGIIIPETEYGYFYTDTYSDDERIEIIYDTSFYYYSDISDLIDDSVWLDEMPDKFIEMIPFPENYIIDDNCILYNVDTGEINKVPTESGEHRLVFLSYYNDGEGGYIEIYEYILSL